MKRFLTALAFICVVLSSCTDEVYPKNESNPEEAPTISVGSSLETLHSLQVDKQIMLSSMIRYDSSKEKYILDLSFKDAELLDISQETYDEINSLVSKMNGLNFSKR